MSIIKVLPEHVANKIAAGEVVERPAAIVKELVENSLDAQSTQIDIIVKNGGSSYIRIADNGNGMDAEDASLCFTRHATSKLASIGDLYSLESFGFRGEALSSIAAVSRMKLTTRTKTQEIGSCIQIDGGSVSSTTEAGCAPGTIIEIEDLFFNTPARRKFLKKEKTELGYIEDTFVKLALSHYTVGFSLSNDQNKVHDLPAATSLSERIKQLKNESYFNNLVEISDQINENLSFHGYISMPSHLRSNRTEQFIFINKRSVKHLGLSYALTQSYQGLIPSDKFPICILFFNLDPKQVDINIHPTKREVKISNEKLLKTRLINTIKNTLTRSDIFKRISFSNDVSQIVQEINDMTANAKQPHSVHDGIPDAVSRYYNSNSQQMPSTVQYSLHNQNHSFQNEFFKKDTSSIEDASIIGQAHKSYVIAQTEDSILLIDQHAAHERVLYEKLLSSIEDKNTTTSQSIIPITLELSFKESSILDDYLGLLNNMGFSIHLFGENTYTVDGVPDYIDTSDIQGFMKDCIDYLTTEKIETNIDKKKKNLAAAVACKKRAIKANSSLQPEEMKALIKSLATAKSPFTCPHGRPTLIKIPMKHLEKQFGR